MVQLRAWARLSNLADTFTEMSGNSSNMNPNAYLGSNASLHREGASVGKEGEISGPSQMLRNTRSCKRGNPQSVQHGKEDVTEVEGWN